MRRAFTLIELLMVVAIIAILAAIAIPNLLDAQVRAKVSRARSDLRSISVAIEAYATDQNHIPPNQYYFLTMVAPERVTTPVAYITSLPLDPFHRQIPNEILMRYEYNNVRQNVDEELSGWPPTDLIRYGDWRLISYGPRLEHLPWIPYDPTNGTVSTGNILRTQRSPEGRILYKFWDPDHPNE